VLEMPERPSARPDGTTPVSLTTVPGNDDGDQVVDRAAAFAAGPPRLPGKVMAYAVACLVVLGLGGVVLDHFLPGPVGAAAAATTSGDYPPPLPTVPTRTALRAALRAQLRAPTSALMGLQRLSGREAPRFSLVDQYGQRASLEDFRGKVVVLSFFDAACDDICGVLETELSQAFHDLGADRSQVDLVTVNTDPVALTVASTRPAEEATISSATSWDFLTGSLAQLDPVWTSYGVTIEVQRHAHAESHSDLLYFIDASGRLRLRATPYADEAASGSFSLPRATEAEWAAGIAEEARSLIGHHP